MGEMVTIPREEYDRLREAAEGFSDILAYDSAKAALARGDEELIPAEMVDRIIDGESPLRVFREYRGLSQSSLAATSGVNRIQIVNIEAGRNTGSVDTLKKLAAALNVDLDMIT